MIQLEVIVRVNQARKDECTVEIDHVIVAVRRLVERQTRSAKRIDDAVPFAVTMRPLTSDTVRERRNITVH